MDVAGAGTQERDAVDRLRDLDVEVTSETCLRLTSNVMNEGDALSERPST